VTPDPSPSLPLGRRAVLAGGAGLAAWLAVAPLRIRSAWGAPARLAGRAAPFPGTLAAYASTLVPGPIDDPSRTGGAYEAGGVQVLLDQLPEVAPVVVADVEAAALTRHFAPFTTLTYSQRQDLLVKLFADPLHSTPHLIAFALIAGAYYGDMVNRVGSKNMGLPGPSKGYLATYTDRTGHGQPQCLAIPA
jgi:hypothetical protein